MLQFSQTSWQEYSLTNLVETLSFQPLNLNIGKSPLFHYTFPTELEAGGIITYSIQVGFRVIKWTGIISSVKENQILVRLNEGPFRGFTAKHAFKSEGNLTACYEEFSFQGFTDIPENVFDDILKKAHLVYNVSARKEMRNIMLSFESQKKTQAFEAFNQSATAG